MSETLAKLGVGSPKCLLGIDIDEPRQIHQHEEEIAQFIFDLVVRSACASLSELAPFLVELFENFLSITPIEPGARGARSNLLRLDQRRQRTWNACEQSLWRLPFFFPFFFFDFVPALHYFVAGSGRSICEDVRMAADQLLVDCIERISDIEELLFRRHLGKEDSLQHEVAQFGAQFVPVAAIDSVQHLVRLFECVGFDRIESLFAVPRASAGSPQPRHDIDQPLKFCTCAVGAVFVHWEMLRGKPNVALGCRLDFMSEEVESAFEDTQDNDNSSRPALPPADFDFLVYSLRLQAELNLGLLPLGAPGEENQEPDFELARHNIDLLGVLQEKTKGNLTVEEQRALDHSVTELRFRFIQVQEQSKVQ